jgi:two-component system response regulator NreC
VIAMSTIQHRPQLTVLSDHDRDQAVTLSVVIAESHEQMRRALRRLLEGEKGITVEAETVDLESTARVVAERQPDLLVLDMSMPGSTLQALRDLRSASPATQTVVLSTDDAPAVARGAIAAGAIAYVLKEFADEDLPSALRFAARGDEYLSARVAQRLTALRQALTEGRLTARESDVLRLIALGHTNVEIARKLEVSARTIETHRANIHEKLGLRTRAELVRFALRCGLLES